MSDPDLDKIRMKKTELLLKQKLMPTEIIHIHSLEELNNILTPHKKILIIDFWAVWCGPCKIFAPVFEKLHQEYYQDFIFAKINVDEDPAIASKYMISGIPTTLFLRNDKIIGKIVGATNYESMRGYLEKLKDFNH